MFWRYDFPAFPKKWVITGPTVVDERRFMFDYYLKTVFKVRVIQQSDIVQNFLKLDKSDEAQTNHYSSMTSSQNIEKVGESLGNLHINGQTNGHLNQPAVPQIQTPAETSTISQTPEKVPDKVIEKKVSKFASYFENGHLPVIFYTENGHEILKFKVEGEQTINDILNFVVKELQISSDFISLHCELFCLYSVDDDLNKLNKVENFVEIQNLVDNQTILMFGRWGKLPTTSEELKSLIEKDENTQKLLFNEFKHDKLIGQSNQLNSQADQTNDNSSEIDNLPTNISELMDHQNFMNERANNFTFNPCTCDLRTDGTLMQITINLQEGICLKLEGSDMKLKILFSHIVSYWSLGGLEIKTSLENF